LLPTPAARLSTTRSFPRYPATKDRPRIPVPIRLAVRLEQGLPMDLELPTLLHFSDFFRSPTSDRSIDIRVAAWQGVTPVVFAEALFAMPDAGDGDRATGARGRCVGQLKMLADASLASSCPDLQTCRAGRGESIDRQSESIQAEDTRRGILRWPAGSARASLPP
jgi:hypothetical protein